VFKVVLALNQSSNSPAEVVKTPSSAPWLSVDSSGFGDLLNPLEKIPPTFPHVSWYKKKD